MVVGVAGYFLGGVGYFWVVVGDDGWWWVAVGGGTVYKNLSLNRNVTLAIN